MNTFHEHEGEIVPSYTGVNQPRYPRGSKQDAEMPHDIYEGVVVSEVPAEDLGETLPTMSHPNVPGRETAKDWKLDDDARVVGLEALRRIRTEAKAGKQSRAS